MAIRFKIHNIKCSPLSTFNSTAQTVSTPSGTFLVLGLHSGAVQVFRITDTGLCLYRKIFLPREYRFYDRIHCVPCLSTQSWDPKKSFPFSLFTTSSDGYLRHISLELPLFDAKVCSHFMNNGPIQNSVYHESIGLFLSYENGLIEHLSFPDQIVTDELQFTVKKVFKDSSKTQQMCLATSVTGSILCVANEDCILSLVEITQTGYSLTATIHLSLQKKKVPVWILQPFLAGSVLFVSTEEVPLRIFCLKTFVTLQTLNVSTLGILCACSNQDENILWVAGIEPTVTRIEMSSTQKIWKVNGQIKVNHYDIEHLFYFPSQDMVVAINYCSEIYRLSNEKAFPLHREKNFSLFQLATSSKTLALNNGREIDLWSLQDTALRSARISLHDPVLDWALSHDAQRLVVLDNSEDVIVSKIQWAGSKIESISKIANINCSMYIVYGLAFPGGDTLAIICNKVVILINFSSDEHYTTTLIDLPDMANGTCTFCTGNDNHLYIFDSRDILFLVDVSSQSVGNKISIPQQIPFTRANSLCYKNFFLVAYQDGPILIMNLDKKCVVSCEYLDNALKKYKVEFISKIDYFLLVWCTGTIIVLSMQKTTQKQFDVVFRQNIVFSNSHYIVFGIDTDKLSDLSDTPEIVALEESMDETRQPILKKKRFGF